MGAKSFQELLVWQKAHALVLKTYRLTNSLPKSELYGLTSQSRRAAVSVPANIAEGFVKGSVNDKLRFYNIAQGSLEELKYYFILMKDLEYTTNIQEVVNTSNEVGRLLNGYIAKIKKTKLGVRS